MTAGQSSASHVGNGAASHAASNKAGFVLLSLSCFSHSGGGGSAVCGGFTSSGLGAFQQASAKSVQLSLWMHSLLAYVAPTEQHGDQAEGLG